MNPPLDLVSLRLFAKVAELTSFTQAAEQLHLPKSRVSALVQQLEAQVGARLLHRTTRRVRLTQDGEQFLARCTELLAQADELQTLFARSPQALRGRLRVDLPNGLARSVVIPQLPAFLAAHPQIEVELSATDRRVDVVREGFDCVLRVGALEDSGLVARRLGELRLVNCVSAGYAQAHGVPRELDDLDRHWLVRYAPGLAGPTGFEYFDGEAYRLRPMPGRITVNSSDAYQAACLAGLGIVQVPAMAARSLIEQGLWVEVLPQHPGAPMPVSLLYPHRRHVAPRVEAFMSWLAEVLGPYLAAVTPAPAW
jgi:DNA-binding transcriptional LysR family regulator